MNRKEFGKSTELNDSVEQVDEFTCESERVRAN